MSKNKKNKIIGVIIVIIILTIINGIFVFVSKNNKKPVPSNLKDNIEFNYIKDTQYPIIKKDYDGEYDIQTIDVSQIVSQEEIHPDTQKVMTYDEYVSYCSEWNFSQRYTDKTKNYIVFSYTSRGAVSVDVRLAGIDIKENEIELYIWDDPYGVTADSMAYTIFIPTTENINKQVSFINTYTNEEFKNLKKYGALENPDDMVDKKPVIYIYPEEKMEVNIKLNKPNNITCSYPKYNESWKINALPNGDLIDLNTKRNLYCLYYESINDINFKIEDEGFVIKGENAATFLEEKLKILGLNEKEAEEFIIYWLPKLESNKYNYIRFATKEEITENMALEITPKPDTEIRILMTFKGLNNPINVKEQELTPIQRTGYSVVEWGGTEIR